MENLDWRELYLFGVVIHLVMLALMLTLPWDTAVKVLAQISLPVLSIYPVATTLLGLLMVNRLRRETLSAQLQDSEERLRLALAAANQGLYDLNVQTGQAEVSPEYATMLGYEPAEFHETNAAWIARLHPDDHAAVSAVYREYVAGRIPEYRVEFRQKTRAGDWKWILSLGKVVEHDAEGRPLRMLGTHTDITQRKQAEEMLRLFKVLVENASDAIGMSTPAGRHYYQNEAFTLLFGEIGEDPPATLYVDQEVGRQVFRTIMAGQRWEGEVQMYSADRREITIFLRAYGNKDSAGRVIGLVGIHTDITARKQAEEALRQSEARLRSLIDSSPFGAHLYELDSDNQLVIAGYNQSAERILGIPNSQFVGKRPEEAFPALVDTDLPAQYRSVAISGERLDREVEYGDGNVNGTFEIHAFQTGAGKMAVFFLDISERKRAEEERERLREQLLQAQKMESVGRLAGGVAHDFNNILQTILGYCDLSLCQMDEGDPLHENLVEIHKAALRSAELTRQLLAFARKQTAAPRVLDLNDTVAGMLRMLQRLIGENIDLAWVPGHDLWRVKIDPSQLDQILANLTVNARDAIAAGAGKITITTENIPKEKTTDLVCPEFVPADYVLLSVHDTGSGMDLATQAQIFEPFFTTKELGKGTGLGLATVYGIVRQNNGYLTVESAPGAGATFRIYLPRVVEHHEDSAPDCCVMTPVGGTETVLLVEDEEAILKLGKGILELGGYTVLAAMSASEALRLGREHPGPIDLLITDVVMPEMNGRELANQLAEFRPKMACLYMSGYTADIIASHGVLAKGVHFIAKPFSVNDLCMAVRTILNGKCR